MSGFLTKIFGGKAAEIATSVTDGLDKLFTSKEEKLEAQLKIQDSVQEHLETMTQLAQNEVDSYLKDVQSARENNTKIQESDKASWLAKNAAYIMDGIFVGAFIAMLFVIIYKNVPDDNKEIFYTAFGLLGGFVGTTVNFHRGTSVGSKANGDAIRKIIDKQ